MRLPDELLFEDMLSHLENIFSPFPNYTEERSTEANYLSMAISLAGLGFSIL